MIKLMLSNKLYSKSVLFDYLENNQFSTNKIDELYKIYNKEKNNIKIKESNIITKEDLARLLTIAKKLLREVKNLLKWGRESIRKELKVSRNK